MEVLETVFQKSPAEAYRIMMQVHLNGRGVAGVYRGKWRRPRPTRSPRWRSEAGFPLRATVEEA